MDKLGFKWDTLINIVRSNPHITQKDFAVELNVQSRIIEHTMSELQENGKIEHKGDRHYAY
ncbi:MAG TPA: hypothetical protein PLT36_04605 [Erysipelotrichaceae bacterium]|jgi:Mn-dependent DtxR family transcriptional regulator|nr:hypothetical protein [Erysipelotrichaceae bacterium]HQA84645.1 hypothetical protein [Erysipelotrichaceae bacterium]